MTRVWNNLHLEQTINSEKISDDFYLLLWKKSLNSDGQQFFSSYYMYMIINVQISKLTNICGCKIDKCQPSLISNMRQYDGKGILKGTTI
jgi:hypothetical protein